MLIGYARVSKADGSQSLDLQRVALQVAGVDAGHVYHDFASDVRDDRPGLDSCVRALRTGDVLVVWKLDRLGRNLAHLVNTVQDLSTRGVVACLCGDVGNTWRDLMIIRGHAWIGVKTMVLMSALLVTVACGDDDGPTLPTAPSPIPPVASSGSLQLSLDGLESLGAGFVYEGWLLVDGNPVSTGTFSVGAGGSLSTSMFSVDQAALQAATKFILTIEPSPDSSPMPAATKYLAGDFVGNNASLSVGDAATLGNDFQSASGGFILATPSTNAVADDYASGIWWLDPASHSASLMLPALPAGWMYEGWVVGPDGPVTTGRFTEATGADSDGGGPGAGPDGTPAVPGQEFITPPVSLIGYLAVISIEPEPDDSPGPFTLKPLVDMDIEDVGAMVLQDMANNAASFPTGMATR